MNGAPCMFCAPRLNVLKETIDLDDKKTHTLSKQNLLVTDKHNIKARETPTSEMFYGHRQLTG
jgi:hypothetical protein